MNEVLTATLPEFPDYVVCSDGTIIGQSGRPLKPRLNHGGYEQVKLYVDGVGKNVSVHRLVALTFLPERDEEQVQVNHIDGGKRNNDVSNLEWTTPRENTHHANRTGLMDGQTSKMQTVYCGLTGLTFHSIHEAADFYELPIKTLHNQLCGTHPNCTPLSLSAELSDALDSSNLWDWGQPHPGKRRRVRCTKTGEVFESVAAAARAIGMPLKTLHNQLTGRSTNRTSFVFA